MSWLVGGVEGVHATATTTAPTWGPIASDTADILQLIAEQHPATPNETAEWMFFVDMLVMEAELGTWLIDPNRLRDRLRGHVSPPRIGAFTRRALLAGLVEYSGQYVESDDVTSGNRGKPCRVLRWLGDLPSAPSPALGGNSEVAVRLGSQAAASDHSAGGEQHAR